MLTEEQCNLLFTPDHRVSVETRRRDVANMGYTFGAKAVVLNEDMTKNLSSIMTICFGGITGAAARPGASYVLVAVPDEVKDMTPGSIQAFYEWVENDSSFSHITEVVGEGRFILVDVREAPEVEVRAVLILIRAMTELANNSRPLYSESLDATGNVPFSLLMAHTFAKSDKSGSLNPKRTGTSHLLISPRQCLAHHINKTLFGGEPFDLSGFPAGAVFKVTKERMMASATALFCSGNTGYGGEEIKGSLAQFMEAKAPIEVVRTPFDIQEVSSVKTLKQGAQLVREFLGDSYTGPLITWEDEPL